MILDLSAIQRSEKENPHHSFDEFLSIFLFYCHDFHKRNNIVMKWRLCFLPFLSRIIIPELSETQRRQQQQFSSIHFTWIFVVALSYKSVTAVVFALRDAHKQFSINRSPLNTRNIYTDMFRETHTIWFTKWTSSGGQFQFFPLKFQCLLCISKTEFFVIGRRLQIVQYGAT